MTKLIYNTLGAVFLGSPFKILSCDCLIKKYIFIHEKKATWQNLRGKLKEQHLSTVPKSYSKQNNTKDK